MAKKAFSAFVLIIAVYTTKVYAMTLRYESPFSYGVLFSVDVFLHPQTPDKFIEDHISCTVAQRFVPGGGLFLEYRFLNSIGVSLMGTYVNRSFAHDSDFIHTKTITNVYCMDVALVASILPKGYGGVSFYVGPKGYFIMGSDAAEYTYKGKKKKIDSVAKKFVKHNIGALLGFKIEIDRTGFIAGAEVEKFFKPMQIVQVMPEIYKDDGRYVDKKESWLCRENKNRFSAFGWRIYIGYDFGRLHSED